MFEKNCHRRTQDWQGITVAKLPQENWKMQTVTNLHCWVCDLLSSRHLNFLIMLLLTFFFAKFISLYHDIIIGYWYLRNFNYNQDFVVRSSCFYCFFENEGEIFFSRETTLICRLCLTLARALYMDWWW